MTGISGRLARTGQRVVGTRPRAARGAVLLLTCLAALAAVVLREAQASARARKPPPTVSVPTVSTPSVTVPTVTVPPVTVPSVTVPSVSPPPLPQPSVPPVSTLSGSSHAPAGGGSASAGSAPVVAQALGAIGGVTAGTSGPVVSLTSHGSASGDSASSGSRSSGSASGARSASRRHLIAGSDHHGGFTKRYLHRLLTRDSSCLLLLPSQQANILVLRTGLGIKHAFNRRQAARYLGISLAKEGRLERRAVSSVVSSAKQGACSRAARANRNALFLSAPELALLRTPLPRAFATPLPRRVSAARKARAASHKHQKHHKQSVSAASTGGVPASIPSLAHPGTSSFPWLFVALGLVLATAVASPLARRRWVHPQTVDSPSPSPGARRPGAGIGKLAAERAGAVGAAAAAGAATLRSKRPRGRVRGAETPPAEAARTVQRARHTPAAPHAGGSAAAAEPGAGAIAAAAGAAAMRREEADKAPATSSLAARLESEGDIDGAIAAYRRADAAGDAAGATNLGVLLEQRGDFQGALDAYRRADARGDTNGSFNLGCLLAEMGELPSAVEAMARADQRGDPAGASNLGVLLEQQGDLERALEAYRRADERGDPNGSFNLGLLLANRGDVTGAEGAYRRAGERGDREMMERARAALAELSQHNGHD